MSEQPACFTQKDVKARKAHVCCECREQIATGVTYVRTTGVWDCQGQTFKQCQRCYEVSRLACDIDLCGDEDPPSFGDLALWMQDEFGDAVDAKTRAEVIELGGKLLTKRMQRRKKL